MLESTTKAIIYGYFTLNKVNKNGEEKGLICINLIKPKTKESATDIGWEASYYWVDFNDELFKYLKSTLIKQSDITLRLTQDYKDSNKYTSQLVKINDFVIKQ